MASAATTVRYPQFLAQIESLDTLCEKNFEDNNSQRLKNMSNVLNELEIHSRICNKALELFQQIPDSFTVKQQTNLRYRLKRVIHYNKRMYNQLLVCRKALQKLPSNAYGTKAIATHKDILKFATANLEKSDTVQVTKTKAIGGGAFGSVSTGSMPTLDGDYSVFYKESFRADPRENRKELMDESSSLMAMQHRYIVESKYLDYGKDPQTNEPRTRLFMEKGICSLQRLMGVKRPFILRHINRYAREMLSAVAYINFHGYVHRDLKPANIVLEDSNEAPAKLIDFGMMAKQGEAGGVQGSPLTIAPELFKAVLSGKPAIVTAKNDAWSLGATLFQLISGKDFFFPTKKQSLTVFVGKLLHLTQEQINEQINELFNTPSAELEESIPDPAKREQLKNTLLALLKLDPEERMSADEALQAFYMDSEAPDPEFLKERDSKAAVAIQATAKGMLARNKLRKEKFKNAATKIQAAARGLLAKKAVAKRRRLVTTEAPIPVSKEALILKAARLAIFASEYKATHTPHQFRSIRLVSPLRKASPSNYSLSPASSVSMD